MGFLEKEIAAQDAEHKSAHDKRVEQDKNDNEESEQANADAEGRREEGDFNNPLAFENVNVASEENDDGGDDLARYVEAMCQACLKAGGRQKDMPSFKEDARKQLEECRRE